MTATATTPTHRLLAAHAGVLDVIRQAREAAAAGGVALSENLAGQVCVIQVAAFSDFHGTGANPAASAHTDAAFVAGRFRVTTSRRHL